MSCLEEVSQAFVDRAICVPIAPLWKPGHVEHHQSWYWVQRGVSQLARQFAEWWSLAAPGLVWTEGLREVQMMTAVMVATAVKVVYLAAASLSCHGFETAFHPQVGRFYQ